MVCIAAEGQNNCNLSLERLPAEWMAVGRPNSLVPWTRSHLLGRKLGRYYNRRFERDTHTTREALAALGSILSALAFVQRIHIWNIWMKSHQIKAIMIKWAYSTQWIRFLSSFFANFFERSCPWTSFSVTWQNGKYHLYWRCLNSARGPRNVVIMVYSIAI